MSGEQTVQIETAKGKSGSALRQVIENSRLSITPRQSYNPMVSESLAWAGDARKLNQDFETLGRDILALDQRLTLSETVSKLTTPQFEDLKGRFDTFKQTEIGTDTTDREGRQKKLDNMIGEMKKINEKVNQRFDNERKQQEERRKEQQKRKKEIEGDQELIGNIGTTFDNLQETYSGKLDPAQNERINQLRNAFREVTEGTRPLTVTERVSATTLYTTDSEAWRALFDRHAKAATRLDDQDLTPPPKVRETEGSDIQLARGQIDSARKAIGATLGKRPITEDMVNDADDRIEKLAVLVKQVAGQIETERQEQEGFTKRRTELLKLLKTDPYADPPEATKEQCQPLDLARQLISDTLKPDLLSQPILTQAEQTLDELKQKVVALVKTISDERQAQNQRNERGREILGLLKSEPYTIPHVAKEQQTEVEALGRHRQTIETTLRDEPFAVDAISIAEQALRSLGDGVTRLKDDIAEAKAASERPEILRRKRGDIDFQTFGPLLKDDPQFKASRDYLGKLFANKGPATLTAEQFKEADGHITTVEQRIAERISGFLGQKEGFQQWLKSFDYLNDEIIQVSRTDKEPAKDFSARLLALRLTAQQALDLDIAKFDDAKVDQALAALNDLAIEIQTRLHPPTSGTVTTFDWKDPATWTKKSLRFDGTGTADYVDGLSGADTGMIDRIRACDVGDRHSAAKIYTGKPMHQHADGGSGGISFAYGHLGGNDVEPVIYDYASKRQGNTYEWRHGGDSNGPSALPGGIKARV